MTTSIKSEEAKVLVALLKPLDRARNEFKKDSGAREHLSAVIDTLLDPLLSGIRLQEAESKAAFLWDLSKVLSPQAYEEAARFVKEGNPSSWTPTHTLKYDRPEGFPPYTFRAMRTGKEYFSKIAWDGQEPASAVEGPEGVMSAGRLCEVTEIKKHKEVEAPGKRFPPETRTRKQTFPKEQG